MSFFRNFLTIAPIIGINLSICGGHFHQIAIDLAKRLTLHFDDARLTLTLKQISDSFIELTLHNTSKYLL